MPPQHTATGGTNYTVDYYVMCPMPHGMLLNTACTTASVVSIGNPVQLSSIIKQQTQVVSRDAGVVTLAAGLSNLYSLLSSCELTC